MVEFKNITETRQQEKEGREKIKGLIKKVFGNDISIDFMGSALYVSDKGTIFLKVEDGNLIGYDHAKEEAIRDFADRYEATIGVIGKALLDYSGN